MDILRIFQLKILNIEEVYKKRIVTRNLKEAEENVGITDWSKLKGDTWATKYLQGLIRRRNDFNGIN